MTLALYFFRQFFPSFAFGTVLFMFVLLLDKLFDIVDLIFNKGVSIWVVGQMFMLFIPTVLPLTMPMAVLLASLVTFGRLSEENELTAVRAAGISLYRALWLPPVFALVLSVGMVPFNTHVAPWANRAFRVIYERIVRADPLINIEAKKFFSIKNFKLYAESVDKESRELKHLFVYQLTNDGRPAQRIYAQSGQVSADPKEFDLFLHAGQLQRYDPNDPRRLLHTTFESYQIAVPLETKDDDTSTRFRNLASQELRKMIQDMKKQGLPTAPLEAEDSLRVAIAFAPLALGFIGIPLATALRRGGRGFGFGMAIVVIFIYYTLLILGLTLAEKGLLPPDLSLWMGNIVCFLIGGVLFARLMRQ